MKQKKQRKIKKTINSLLKRIFYNRILFYIILIVSFFLLFLYIYIYSNFSNITLDQLLYSLNNSEGTDTSVIINGAFCVSILLLFIIFLCVVFELAASKFNSETFIKIKIKNKTFHFIIFPISKFKQHLFCWIFGIFILVFIFINMDFISFFYKENSSFIGDHYVNPKKTKITKSGENQNLIYIFVESLESSFVTKKNGGAFDNAIIPNLETLALDNINFSNNSKIGGADMVNGANWTVAGMVAQTAGIPLKVPLDDYNTYNDYTSFLPGVYSLGDVLKDNGYNNYLLLGSASGFGGKKDYFSYHGNYALYDYGYSIVNKWLPKDYKVWWGFEDKKLFKFAKSTLKEISSKDEPFNYMILTANTHFIDGRVDKGCEKPFKEKYLNSYYCSDYEIGEFIDWVKKQDFYDNTTIVIAGDHLTMQSNIVDMFDVQNAKKYDRKIYNVIINSKNKNPVNNKNRSFNSFDLYPTTLSALGFDIEGERLGLGTNLFSSKKTLTEKYGFKYMNEEISKKSDFYNKKLLANTYQEMLMTKTKKNKTENNKKI
ncbi:MAG: sulfatase-like hydrolase/transferase [Bacilli bacterium]|nr:sulfatase-like hydrolase/transferase [Bacilli bacterium]